MRLEQQLGSGKDGEVFATSAATAVKGHGRRGSFQRELACFERLRDHGVELICGFHVPRIIDRDEQLMIIEMNIVTPPFLLDFGNAYLDDAPDFSVETLEQWRLEKTEQFEDRWPEVENVLEYMKTHYDIHLMDIHPGNIRTAPATD